MEIERVLDQHVAPSEPRAVCHHCGHHRLQECGTVGDGVIGPADGIALGPTLVMDEGPIQRHDGTSAPPILSRDRSAMPWPQRGVIPAGLKDPGVHGTSRRRLPVPDLQVVYPLQGLVRANDQPCHIPADVCKAFLATAERAQRCHALGNCLWHARDRQHRDLPVSCVARAYLPCFLLRCQELSKWCVVIVREVLLFRVPPWPQPQSV
jgi:hypothetical protein